MTFEKNLEKLSKLLSTLRGKADIKQRLSFLFDPDNIKTASRLNGPQVEFMTDAFLSAKFYPQLQGMEDLAQELGESTISHKGLGREESIHYEQATSTSGPATQVGVFQTASKKEEKKPKDEKQ